MLLSAKVFSLKNFLLYGILNSLNLQYIKEGENVCCGLWENRAVCHKSGKTILDSMTSLEIKHMKIMCIIDDSAVQDYSSKNY